MEMRRIGSRKTKREVEEGKQGKGRNEERKREKLHGKMLNKNYSRRLGLIWTAAVVRNHISRENIMSLIIRVLIVLGHLAFGFLAKFREYQKRVATERIVPKLVIVYITKRRFVSVPLDQIQLRKLATSEGGANLPRG
jgi:hypothetical protein